MFKGNKKSQKAVQKELKNTFISRELEIEGDLKGKYAIQIEGTIHGDISLTSVVIGEHGTVNGNIIATNVIINGTVNGSVTCSSLEIMPNGYVSNNIQAKKLLISGRADSIIEADEEININSTAKVTATLMKSKNIMINGIFKGNVIASELLIIGAQGYLSGEITVKKIKTYEGGKLLGSLHNYEEEAISS